ncbi:Ubiquitin-protein ligase E3C [Dermatophagoides farinae]|uniref:Ubiquitin-protein ligase E3C n=1 Tax=Dermatophagoides farinae TaxID=6954 RepID=A0A922LAI9_DERFA|nr:Ubiquitin-protein ligase E3C [Dermatophagoides farinae]
MSNSCFNGDFRQKPKQSLGGVNRNLKREQLIQQAAQERKQREEFRKHTQIAIKLQSQIRKYLTCKNWYESLRADFDSKRSQLGDEIFIYNNNNNGDINKQPFRLYDDLHYLAIRFVRFHSYPIDKERLLFINKLLINNQTMILSRQHGLHWLKYVFAYNSSTLAHLLDHFPSNLEEFKLILNTFQCYLNENKLSQTLMDQIWDYLVRNDYMKNIQSILCKIRAIESIGDNFFETVYDVLLRRLLSLQQLSESNQFLLIEHFLSQFLSGLNDFKLLNELLQTICQSRPPLLATENIIRAFTNLDSQSILIQQYLIIFYSAIKLIIQPLHHQMIPNHASNQVIQDYLNILRLFSHRLFAHFRAKPSFNYIYKRGLSLDRHEIADSMEIQDNNDDDDDDFDEDSDYMDSVRRKTPDDERLLFYVKQIFSLLNTAENCNIIIRFIDNHLATTVADSEGQSSTAVMKNALISLSSISHLMLFFYPNAIHHNRMLHTLAFNSNFLKKLWNFVLNESGTVMPFAESTPSTYIHILSRGLLNSSFDWPQFIPHVTIFCALFNYFLQTLDDVEFFNEYLRNNVDTGSLENNAISVYNYSVLPFKLDEIISMCSILRDVGISLIELAYQDRRIINYKINLFGSGVEETIQDEFSINCWSLLLRNLLRLLRHIYARDIRQRFCPENHWISKRTCISILPQNFNIAIKQRRRLYQEFRGIKHMNRDEIIQHGSPISVKDVINVTLIQELPFVASFCDRSYTGRTVTIRRNYVYEDSFEKLSPTLVPSMKKIIRVQLVSALGLEETGVDGGGVFREFLAEALKSAFDPNRGLFKLTQDGFLYPNPSAQILYDNSDSHYYFIGRLLGKAIYEHMLIELPFAPFFLAKILTVNSDIEINHLASLDPVLYKNLISLKNYSGDVSDLGLDFTAVQSDFGANKIEDLKPNGANITVTNQNRIEYIHLMADYKLNKQIRGHCAAFKKGFYNVVDFDWIKMFDTKELQILISGAQTPIDLDDLMAHTVYTGNYNYNHPVIQNFWEVLTEFDENDKRKFLKFVTSCSRPPLLGFKDLCPAFCIQNAGPDPERLPTSSTCMNLLKLPEIHDKKSMKEKLMYAINSGSGFELS